MKRAPKGLVYTILVDGKPIVAFEASGREAAELCKEEWFRAELSALNSSGEPICGTGSKLQARTAIEKRWPNTGKAQRKLRTLMTSCLYI